MREIKFRAWYIPNNYAGDDPKSPRMIYFDEMGYCDEYNHLSFSLAKESREPNGAAYSNLCADIDDFLSVMQFTGLRDENGKEIYEGDILQDRYGLTGSIEYKDTFFCIRFGKGVGGYTRGIWSRLKFGMKLIGNIHENPDLVK